MSTLVEAFRVYEEDPDEAARIANDILRDDTDNAAALYLLGTIYAKAERYGAALPVLERCVKLAPHRHEAWNNLGKVWQECHDYIKARESFKRAHETYKKNPKDVEGPDPSAGYLANIAASFSGQGDYYEAMKWCKKALETAPNNNGAITTLGFTEIATGDWKNGWVHYETCLGGRYRKIIKLADEPKWDGSPVKNLFIYGEQGLGDEIMYASILSDIKNVEKITLECDPRLYGLFKRSFPQIEVYGTRRKTKTWAEGRSFDAGSGIGSLASLLRPTRESCSGTPYLVADPERRIQWRALFDSWGKKPKIGLCWTGGRPATQKKFRNVTVEALKPLMDKVDANWISLQYEDPGELKGIRHFHRALQSSDYDDTAAIVAELDMVIGIHTTVHHLAGAVGTPGIVFVPNQPMWMYAMGDRAPWYQDSRFHRQKKDESWIDCVKRLDFDAIKEKCSAKHLRRVRS